MLLHVAVLVATLAAVLAGPLPARAASSVQLDARALAGARFEVGGWIGISATLVNTGEPTDGHLTATTDAGTVRRAVELPAGARKTVTLYVQPDPFQRAIDVRYEEPNGTVTARVEVRVFESTVRQLAIVGDGAGTLRPQFAVGIDGGESEPIAFGPADIPERFEPLAGVDAMVWAGDGSALSEDQRRSLERWVAGGGELVIVGGPDWQTRTAPFTDLLPLERLAAIDGVEQAALAEWSASSDAPVATATVSTGTLRDSARALVTADDGTILVSMLDVGAGRVILVGTDLATDTFRGWDGAPRLWTRLLPSNAALEGFFGAPVEGDLATAMSQALGNIPSLEVPPAELLLAVIVGYILLIGPISYLVLRRMDRRELAWVTAPILVLVFSACSYGIGAAAKGGDVILNEIALVRTSSHGTTATVETYAGIFSPNRSTYDVAIDHDALLGRLQPNNGFGQEPNSTAVADQGRPSTLRGLSIGVFGFEAISAAGIVDHVSPLSVTWATDDDGDLVGTVTNTGDETIEDVAYISQSGGEMVGDIAPGATTEFTIPRLNFNGSSASDQVYGFGGFDNASEEQRRILVRRQVIDALVGYGGFMPGVDLGPAAARGPFLIGWRDAEGPMPFTVEGLDARRSTTTVEVLGVRPTPASGEVTISPAAMAVAVVETTGNAGMIGPGMVTVSQGSATFSVTLPLEASDLVASEIEILIGPDPSMALSEGGAFGGFWAPGTVAELRDPSTGEWIMLGDLSEQSTFELDDPAAAIGGTGSLLVRVTGGEPNPNFGDPSVFVSARVSGTVAP